MMLAAVSCRRRLLALRQGQATTGTRGGGGRSLCSVQHMLDAREATCCVVMCHDVLRLLPDLCRACRVSPARIACLDMNLQKARLHMGVQVGMGTRSFW